MIPGIELTEFIRLVGVLGVALVVFAESGLLIGFFLPGDSLLFTAGFLAQSDVLHVNVHVLAGVLFIAAAFGDSVGYAFGRRVGRRLFHRKESLLFHKDNLQRAEEFYEKHGAKTIVLARFIPIVRTFAPIVAGISKMDYTTFLIFNLSGAFIWAVGLTYLGYFTGSWFESKGIDIDHYLLPIIAVIVLLSVLPPIIHILRDRKQRALLRSALKRQLSRLNLK